MYIYSNSWDLVYEKYIHVIDTKGVDEITWDKYYHVFAYANSRTKPASGKYSSCVKSVTGVLNIGLEMLVE